ncbi:RNA methyltransferase [candidate division WWE3 bacterium]|nr:RNA methyltransferase [candidate division WWE3 bacterium]
MSVYPIHLVLHNIRSLHNVGSMFRLADCAGIEKVYVSGITPYPEKQNDTRKPWDIRNAAKGIHKTALGAEKSVSWDYYPDIVDLIKYFRTQRIPLIGLETSKSGKNLYEYQFTGPIALVVGHEIDGISDEILLQCDEVIEIPMYGKKESLNVAISAAIVVYEAIRQFSLLF